MTVGPSRSNVTVLFDAAAESIWAVTWAADEAACRAMPLHIVQHLRPGATEGWWAGPDIEALVEGETSALDAIATVAKHRHADLIVHTIVPDPADRSAASRALEDATLVVAGTRQEPHITGFRLGNSPRWLRDSTTCPVVVVGQPVQPHRPRRVVVAYAGHDGPAIDWACDEATVHGVCVTILHVSGRGDADVRAGRQLLDAAVAHARRFPVAVCSELRQGNPPDEILQACSPGDLLVLGTGRRRPVASALLGTTIDTVLGHAHVPVVIVPEELSATGRVGNDGQAEPRGDDLQCVS